MCTQKPRIKPKAEPYQQSSEPPPRDPPSFPEHDPPVFSERDPGTDEKDEKAEKHVMFREDDCLG